MALIACLSPAALIACGPCSRVAQGALLWPKTPFEAARDVPSSGSDTQLDDAMLLAADAHPPFSQQLRSRQFLYLGGNRVYAPGGAPSVEYCGRKWNASAWGASGRDIGTTFADAAGVSSEAIVALGLAVLRLAWRMSMKSFSKFFLHSVRVNLFIRIREL